MQVVKPRNRFHHDLPVVKLRLSCRSLFPVGLSRGVRNALARFRVDDRQEHNRMRERGFLDF